MSHKAAILGMASTLSRGDTVREVCPACGGGSDNEKSLSLTLSEDGQVLWHCFRNKCTLDAGKSTKHISINSGLVKPKRKVFDGLVYDLSEDVRQRVHALWGITDFTHMYWTDSYRGRLAMSIRSPKYLHRGWVLRDIYNKSDVKALSFIDEGEEGISWYKNHVGADTIIVEDIPSAVRASSVLNAVALCGTGVGLSRAMEIQEHAPGRKLVALDQDATAEAFRIARKWALLWGDVAVLPLKKDIKNMTEEELKELLA